MKVLYCVFVNSDNLRKIELIHGSEIEHFKKSFSNFEILNFYNIYKKKIKNDHSSLGSVLLNDKNEFERIYDTYDKIYALDILPRNLKSLKLRRYLSRKKIKLFLIMNIGFLSNQKETHKSTKSKIYNFKKKINYICFRLFIFFNFINPIEIYFDSRKEIVDQCIAANKGKLRSLLDSFFNAKIFKNIFLINSKSYDNFFDRNILNNKKKEKQVKETLVFLDGNYKHQDILMREKINIDQVKKKYFLQLNNFFESLNLKKKYIIEFCLHPSSNFYEYQKYFNKYKIYQFDTLKRVKNADYVFFHESSSIMDAIFLKKKIISLDTGIFGIYYKQRIIEYHKILNSPIFNLDNFKKIMELNLDLNFDKEFIYMNKYIKNYLNSDSKETGKKKVVRILKSFNKI